MINFWLNNPSNSVSFFQEKLGHFGGLDLSVKFLVDGGHGGLDRVPVVGRFFVDLTTHKLDILLIAADCGSLMPYFLLYVFHQFISPVLLNFTQFDGLRLVDPVDKLMKQIFVSPQLIGYFAPQLQLGHDTFAMLIVAKQIAELVIDFLHLFAVVH